MNALLFVPLPQVIREIIPLNVHIYTPRADQIDFSLIGSALRKRTDSRKVDKCGAVFRFLLPRDPSHCSEHLIYGTLEKGTSVLTDLYWR